MTSTSPKIAPSILAADFTKLGDEIAKVDSAGADRIHVDVMDGHFVPNISIGPMIVRAVRRITKRPIESHLMISNADRYLEDFARAGSDSILVHVESSIHLHRTLAGIRELGKSPGVVINPATPANAVEEVLPLVDLVLVMTVNPGFGGQAFLDFTLSKIEKVRAMINATNPNCELEVDGGIDAITAPRAIAAGANVLVAGSAIFNHANGTEAGFQALKQAIS